MTAEEWVEMKEVDERGLPGYLRGLKKEGWSLVGLEQTVGSHDLREVVFPEKMVLVLGNEKEGVPPEIMKVGDGGKVRGRCWMCVLRFRSWESSDR